MIDHRPLVPGRFGHLPTKRPCIECPLARTAEPGRLGGYTIGQYLEVLHGPADIACHLSPGFPDDLAAMRSCTGVAMYRAAQGLRPWGHASEAVKHVAGEPNASFDSPEAFIRHHMGSKP